jgi:hypothetical protein
MFVIAPIMARNPQTHPAAAPKPIHSDRVSADFRSTTAAKFPSITPHPAPINHTATTPTPLKTLSMEFMVPKLGHT